MAITMDFGGSPPPRTSSAVREPDAAERGRAFRQARRHTALVRMLRIALPVMAVACSAYYAVTLMGNSWRIGSGNLRVGQVEMTADDLTMKNPSYFGMTKDGGRYEVRAKKAIVEFKQQAPIKLFDIDSDLIQTNNVKTVMKAKRGLLDNAKSELELFDNIEIDASNGMKARMQRAMIYSKENRIVSKQPVEVFAPTGQIRGASMTMNTKTRQTTFIGDVAVRLVQSGQQPSQKTGQPAPTTSAFGRDSRQPVDVTSDQFHLNDEAHTALFTGNVVAMQGDSTMKAPELTVSYEGKAAVDLTSAPAGQAGESSRLSRLVAKSGVVVTAGADRRITSDEADFDAKADTALFTGNVLVNQVKNVLQGRRLFVDRKAGKSRLDAPAEPGVAAGRIAATFFQSEAAGGGAKPKAGAGEVLSTAQQGVLGSFKTDPNAPMDIDADTLDVNDHAKQAIFRGNVKAQQGDFVVRTVEMTAFYSGQTGFGMSNAPPDEAAAKGAQIVRVEAKQKVLITSKDGQTATGDWAIFDVKANTVLLGGRVVVTRGKDVAEGPRLKIDLTTGMYRFELDEKATAAVATPPPAEPVAPADPVAPATPGASGSPTGRTCPPGKQCLLFYPKEAQDRAKELIKKSPLNPAPKAGDAWEPSTSASPVQRSN